MDLNESVDVILGSDSLALEGFYERLFQRYPEFESYFAGSDLGRQAGMLTMALVGVKQYPDLHAPARGYLEVIGARHHAKGIPPNLYGKFVEVLVDQVADFHGDQWSDELASQWTKALHLAAKTMQGR